MKPTNNCTSVDCVVFGFDGESLKVLLIKRHNHENLNDYKLPGSLIYEEEDLNSAAYRVLEEMTGLRNIYLEQLRVFSDPHRVDGEELQWINDFYHVSTNRVITVAYYSLVKLNPKIISFTNRKSAIWMDVLSIKRLALDHKNILMEALSVLNKGLVNSPVAFELLPRKFTLRQLQTLYEAILGVDLDSRNFRKKILSSGYLLETEEKEEGVAHKPAKFFSFNKSQYNKEQKRKFRMNIINWNQQ